MLNERKEVLNKINDLITKKKNELFKQIPDIHEIEDGIVIRSFSNWQNHDGNSGVKYRKIRNTSNVNDIVMFYYLPKGSIIEMKKDESINNVTCVSGQIELTCGNKTHFLDSYDKICLDRNEFQGKAIENTYIISSNTI